MTETLTSQIVIRYPDSTYVVRTYRVDGDRWVLDRETPASFRDVAQATIDGRVAYAETDEGER